MVHVEREKEGRLELPSSALRDVTGAHNPKRCHPVSATLAEEEQGERLRHSRNAVQPTYENAAPATDRHRHELSGSQNSIPPLKNLYPY
jgi:hypothetical protein